MPRSSRCRTTSHTRTIVSCPAVARYLPFLLNFIVHTTPGRAHAMQLSMLEMEPCTCSELPGIGELPSLLTFTVHTIHGRTHAKSVELRVIQKTATSKVQPQPVLCMTIFLLRDKQLVVCRAVQTTARQGRSAASLSRGEKTALKQQRLSATQIVELLEDIPVCVHATMSYPTPCTKIGGQNLHERPAPE